MMRAKYLFVLGLLLTAWGLGLKSKQFIVKGEAAFREGKLNNFYVDAAGNLALTPTCQKIKTLKEPVIWKVLDTGTSTYATTGHSGRLYAWDREENEVVYESSAKELTALLAWGNDLIIGSGPKGIL